MGFLGQRRQDGTGDQNDRNRQPLPQSTVLAANRRARGRNVRWSRDVGRRLVAALRPPAPPAHCPASVATSFQLGSREDKSRANVQTSVTSVTLSGVPSITVPALSRSTEMSCH